MHQIASFFFFSTHVITSTLVLILVGVTSAKASTPKSANLATALPTAASSQYDTQLRGQWGLSTSATLIDSLAADSNSADTTTLGIPLTQAEAAKVRAQDLLAQHTAEISEKAVLDPALSGSYGGSWIDQSAGGVIHVQIVGSTPPNNLKTIVVATAPGATVKYDSVKYTLGTLLDTFSKVEPYQANKTGIGKYITRTTKSLQTNQIVVSVLPETPENVIDEASKAWGPGGAIIQKSNIEALPQVSRTASTGPLYGGAAIYNKTTGGTCTDGYSHITDSSGRYLTITAGHCGTAQWYQGTGYTAPNTYIGQTTFNSYGSSTGHSNCDCQVIGNIPGGSGTEKVIYSSSTLKTLTSLATTAVQYGQGRDVCVSGRKTGTRCGQITAEGNITYAGSGGAAGWELTDAITTNIAGTEGGDSGAPVFDGDSYTQLVGIHAAGDYLVNSDGSVTSIGTIFSKANHINGSLAVTVGF